jgi:hypothetical protein
MVPWLRVFWRPVCVDYQVINQCNRTVKRNIMRRWKHLRKVRRSNCIFYSITWVHNSETLQSWVNLFVSLCNRSISQQPRTFYHVPSFQYDSLSSVPEQNLNFSGFFNVYSGKKRQGKVSLMLIIHDMLGWNGGGGKDSPISDLNIWRLMVSVTLRLCYPRWESRIRMDRLDESHSWSERCDGKVSFFSTRNWTLAVQPVMNFFIDNFPL